MKQWSTLEKLIWIFHRIKGGAQAIIETITGTLPLVLQNALSHAIVSLTRYGLCTQDGTPTPSAPVDIMCNNGTIRMVDDELPSGYSRLTYIESDGTSGDSGSNGYVDTGIIINSIDTDVEIDFQLTDTYAPSPRMAWGYMGAPSSLPRWGFGAYSSKWLGSPNGTASTGEVDTDRHVAVMRVYNDGSNSAFYNGTLDGETLYNTASLGNVSLFEGNDRWSVYLFARNNNNTAANFVPCKIFRFKVYKTGALANDLVPCKDSNGALGFYDLVTATFSVASGTLIAGAVDYSHAHIGADGTPEVLTVSGPNLLNPATNITGKYITASGGISNGDDAQYTDLIPVKAGETYVCSLVSGRNSGNNRWHGYDANGTWVKQLESVSATGQQGAKLVMAATIDSGISYVRLSYGITDTEAMVFASVNQEISWDGFYKSKLGNGGVYVSDMSKLTSPLITHSAYGGPCIVCNVEPGKPYTVSHTMTGPGKYFGDFYTEAEDVTDGTKRIIGGHFEKSASAPYTFTAPEGAHYVVISFNNSQPTTYIFDDESVVVVVQNDMIADYSPYVAPQTASVPMLLSVGDVKDEAEIISGLLTHKVGVKVLDGTEAWTLNGTMRYVLTISDMATLPGRMEGLCTHFGYAGSGANEGTYFLTSSRRLFFHTKFETVDDLKAFLAAQYAAGTPVIVVYPLAEETTEHTTAQNLSTYEGTNIVDSVANVSPLEAKVKYMTASAQDVLSTLLGMRVTPKDISTQDAEDMIDIITGEDNK